MCVSPRELNSALTEGNRMKIFAAISSSADLRNNLSRPARKKILAASIRATLSIATQHRILVAEISCLIHLSSLLVSQIRNYRHRLRTTSIGIKLVFKKVHSEQALIEENEDSLSNHASIDDENRPILSWRDFFKSFFLCCRMLFLIGIRLTADLTIF